MNYTIFNKLLFLAPTICRVGFPGASDSKESAHNVGDLSLIPGQEDPLEKRMQPTPVFLPVEFHGQRSLAGYSPWDRRIGHEGATNT